MTFFQDVRLALRLIARNPGFAAAAILTLTIAIGANSAIFSVVNALVLKPMPSVRAPEELVGIRAGGSTMSWPNYEDIRERVTTFDGVAAHRTMTLGLATATTPARLRAQAVSADYFTVLGSHATIGRIFTATEGRRDVAVIGDALWRRRFGGDPAVVGRPITLNGRAYEVVGVMPSRFRGVAPPGLVPDVWIPLDTAADPALRDRAIPRVEVVARVRADRTRDSAEAAVTAAARLVRNEHPDAHPSLTDVEVTPVTGVFAFRGALGTLEPVLAFVALLTVVSGLILLIACANLAGLLLGRATTRRREIGVRLALGAPRGRLVRQLLTESLVLALAGGVGGVLLASWLSAGLSRAMNSLPVPIVFDLEPDPTVLVYTLLLSVGTAILFGLAPARRAARFDLVPALKESDAPDRQRARRMLVVGQVAACTALLLWSGLFARSLGRIGAIDPGFEAGGVLLATLDFAGASTDTNRRDQIIMAVQQRIEQQPEVTAAGGSLIVPLALRGRQEFRAWPEGERPPAPGVWVMASTLTPGWFRTLRIQMLAGRDFTWTDTAGAPPVVVINEALARRLWNGQAVGQRLLVPDLRGRTHRPAEVIGVVRDSKYWTLGEAPAPTVYMPLGQAPAVEMSLHVRSADPRATSAALLREMDRLAPDAFVDVSTMLEATSVATLPARVGAAATAAFGGVAVLLAAIGVYGLLSFLVFQRTRELGIRKALGARGVDIVRQVVGRNAALAATGLAIGLGVGWLGAMALSGLIAGVSPFDPLTAAGVGIVVLMTAGTASAAPAWRAVRVDPMITLRDA